MDQDQRNRILSDILDKQLLDWQRRVNRQPTWFERLPERPGLFLAFCLLTAIVVMGLGALSVVVPSLLLKGHL